MVRNLGFTKLEYIIHAGQGKGVTWGDSSNSAFLLRG
jgi:hypothetical protein